MAKKKLENSLADLTDTLGGNWGLPFNPMTPQNSRLDTVFINERWSLISNFRSILSQAYVEYGIVQTLVDQPVSDAFAPGFNIVTDELDDKQKRILQAYLESNRVIEEIKKTFNWARLFGGGGLVIMTDQKPDSEFKVEEIGPDSPLEFRAADMWELYKDQANIWNPWEDEREDLYYSYYGVRLNKTRVLPFKGKEAPSFVRPRLRGWGMSELERVIRSINSYLKNQDLIFELLDEAKVDVYQINGFNTAMLTPQGTKTAEKRIQLANRLKSYLNALVLDNSDKYDQKQLSFNGLAEILNQIRQGVAADLKMPLTKLFGVSAAGFNSGEDDIENYNSMLESEIRSKAKYPVIEVLKICCQKLFGFIPEDLTIEFKSLRYLSAEQEENAKNSQFNRLIQAYANSLISPEQFMIGCNNGNLLTTTFTQEEVMAKAQSGINDIGLEKPTKKGFLSRILGKNEPEKENKPEQASEEGTVTEVDVTSNKFTIPDREKKPLPDKSFPYKGTRKGRFIKVSQ